MRLATKQTLARKGRRGGARLGEASPCHASRVLARPASPGRIRARLGRALLGLGAPAGRVHARSAGRGTSWLGLAGLARLGPAGPGNASPGVERRVLARRAMRGLSVLCASSHRRGKATRSWRGLASPVVRGEAWRCEARLLLGMAGESANAGEARLVGSPHGVAEACPGLASHVRAGEAPLVLSLHGVAAPGLFLSLHVKAGKSRHGRSRPCGARLGRATPAWLGLAWRCCLWRGVATLGFRPARHGRRGASWHGSALAAGPRESRPSVSRRGKARQGWPGLARPVHAPPGTSGLGKPRPARPRRRRRVEAMHVVAGLGQAWRGLRGMAGDAVSGRLVAARRGQARLCPSGHGNAGTARHGNAGMPSPCASGAGARRGLSGHGRPCWARRGEAGLAGRGMATRCKAGRGRRG